MCYYCGMNHKERGKEKLQEALPKAIEKIVELVNSDNEVLAFNAAKLIIERVLGKSVQPVITEGGVRDDRETAKILAQTLRDVLTPGHVEGQFKELSSGDERDTDGESREDSPA